MGSCLGGAGDEVWLVGILVLGVAFLLRHQHGVGYGRLAIERGRW